MIQLAFEPAFDPFHCAFRLLRQAESRGNSAVRIERVKILDVFVAEPRRCSRIRVPPQLRKAAGRAAACQLPTYGSRPTTGAFFDRMSPMQDAAIQTLVLHGLLDADAFNERQALRTKVALNKDLRHRIEAVNTSQQSLVSFLFKDLDAIPLDGVNGLKHRTGIGEYRYDIV